MNRCRQGNKAFQETTETPLCRKTFQFWKNHIAWCGPAIVEAEVVLGEMDENKCLDLIAEYLWDHRDELEDILGDPSETEAQNEN